MMDTFENLDDALARRDEVESLRLADLEEIPAEVFELTRLRELDLSFKAFGPAFDRIERLESLRSLRLQNCWVDAEVPPALFRLPWLTSLMLNPWNARLGSLEGIGRLRGLEELELRDSRRETLPEDLGELANLRRLELFKVHHLGPPPAGLERLRALEEFSASEWKIEEFPAFLVQLPALRKIRLYASPIRSIPEEIGALRDLRELELRGHQLERLPESMGRLVSLTRLYLTGSGYLDDRRSPLALLPESLGDLGKLDVLDLSSNAISRVPASLARCSKLRCLYLKRNELSELPPIATPALEVLDLERNRFQSLPDWVLAGPVSDLHVKGNPLDEATCKRLVQLGVAVDPPPAVAGPVAPAAPAGPTIASGLSAEPDLDTVTLEPGPRRVAPIHGTCEVIAGGADGSWVAYDLEWREAREIASAMTDAYDDPVRPASIASLPDSRFLIADIHSVHRAKLEHDELCDETDPVDLRSGSATAVAIQVASDASGRVAAAVAWEFLVNLSEEAERPFVELEAGLPRFWGVAASPDGGRLAVGRESGAVELRDPRTLEVERALQGLQAPPLSIAFSPDGRWLVAGDDTTRLRLWRVEDGRPVAIEGLGKIVKLAWLSDSSGFLAVGLTRHVGIYRLGETGTPPTLWPEGLDTRYFLDAALVGDRWLAVAVEDTGLLVVDFR